MTLISRARKRREGLPKPTDPELLKQMRLLESKIPDPAARKAYLDAIVPELDRLIEKDNNPILRLKT
jgi:hypothetical protein